MRRLSFVIMLLVASTGSLFAADRQEEDKGLVSVSTDLLTYRVMMNPDADKPMFDIIQFGANMYSAYGALFMPFSEWLQFHLGYRFMDDLYVTGSIGFGLSSVDFYDDDEYDDDERTNLIILVVAPGLRYHVPVSDSVVMPLGFSIGYKGGFVSVKGVKHPPSYHAMKASLYGGVQFFITESFSAGPGLLLDLEYGVERWYDDDGERYEESDLLCIKTGIDLSLSFYF